MQTTNIRKIHKTTLNFPMKLTQIFQKKKNIQIPFILRRIPSDLHQEGHPCDQAGL